MAARARSRGRYRANRPRRIVRLPAEYFEALDLSNVIYPALYQFENGLRLLINGFLGTCYGLDWWEKSLKDKLQTVFEYAEQQKQKLDSMPWIGEASYVEVSSIHLVTLGHLERIVKAYQSDCIPELFPSLDFFTGHMELIKRVRNLYSHMFPCISRKDCQNARSEIRILAQHINAKLG